tara:strand:- start:4280 stop:7405 length:3126 start_codon:yes stop_codon:yes gene_type:complete
MSKFKGYAQSTGFRNIQLPDTSKKILEEGNLTLRRMKEVQQIERENAETYIQALQDKYRIEKANRDSVFQLESENLETVRSAMVRNAETINENARIEADKSKETYEALANFSQKAGEAAVKISKQIKDDQVKSGELFASQLSMYGISMAEAEYVKNMDRAFIANDAKFKAIEDKLLASGAGNNVIERLRSMNSSTFYGLKKTMLVNAGDKYAELSPQWEAADLFDETGKSLGISLGQARLGNQFKDLVDAQDARNKSRFITDYGGADDKFVKAYLFPAIDAYDRHTARQRGVDRAAQLKTERSLQETQDIITAFKHRGVLGLMDYMANHPLKKDARGRVIATLTQMAKSGTLGNGIDVFRALQGAQVFLTPGGKGQSFGYLYGNELGELKQAVQQYEVSDARFKKFEHQQYIKRMSDESFAYLRDAESLPRQVVTHTIKTLQEMGGDTSRHATLLARTVEGEMEKAEDAFLQNLFDTGELSSNHLQGVFGINRKKFQPMLDAWETQLGELPTPDKAIKADLKDQLMEVLGSKSYERTKGAGTFNRALSDAHNMYRSYLKGLFQQSTGGDAAALQQKAFEYVSGQIADQKDTSKRFYVRPQLGDDKIKGSKGDSYFARYKQGDPLYAQPDLVIIGPDERQELTLNPDLLKTDKYVSDGFLKLIEQKIKRGQPIVIPPAVYEMARVTNFSPYEVINQQLERSGSEVRAKPGVLDMMKDRDEVREHPALLEMLTRPFMSNINNVANAAGQKVGRVRIGIEGYSDVVSLSQQSGFKAPNVMAAMWALETGYGKSMSGRNNLFNIKSSDGSGAVTTTKEYNSDGSSYTTSARWREYEAPSQSVDDFISFISSYAGVSEAQTPRELVTALHSQGYATDPGYVDKVVGVMSRFGIKPDAPFMQYSGPPTRDPNHSSSTLQHVYNVGSIGWRSTGPHLDVKQVDNEQTPENEDGQFFHYKDPDIMEYIFADDPELGMIPIGDAPMTGSWEYHSDKGSNGYDYGFHSGTKILIKPPARVVYSQTTPQGDNLMIVEFPNGRRVKFHHGTAS